MEYINKKKNFFHKSCDILFISVKRFIKEQQSRHATSLTYYTLFAIVPILALLFGIAKGFNLDSRLKSFIGEHFSEQQDIIDIMYKFADTTLKQADGGVVAGIGIIILIWTVMRLASYIESSFNQTWQLKKGRNIFRKISDSLSMLLVTPILFVILSSSSILIKKFIVQVSDVEILSMKTGPFLLFGMNLVPVIISMLIFSLIYLFVPNTKVKIKSALLAGFFAALMYQGVQMLYINVQLKLSGYNSIYGSFSALPLFLIWMQWSWMITLLGNLIAFVAQNYGTGQFDTNLEKISDELTLKYTLSVCQLVVNNFEDKDGEVLVIDKIAKRTGLPLIQVQDALYTLVEAGIISRVVIEDMDDLSYTPNVPTDKLTVAEVLKAIRQRGLNHSDALQDIELNKITTLYDKLNLELEKSDNNKLIRDI